jgi:hypothetical protein
MTWRSLNNTTTSVEPRTTPRGWQTDKMRVHLHRFGVWVVIPHRGRPPLTRVMPHSRVAGERPDRNAAGNVSRGRRPERRDDPLAPAGRVTQTRPHARAGLPGHETSVHPAAAV